MFKNDGEVKTTPYFREITIQRCTKEEKLLKYH